MFKNIKLGMSVGHWIVLNLGLMLMYPFIHPLSSFIHCLFIVNHFIRILYVIVIGPLYIDTQKGLITFFSKLYGFLSYGSLKKSWTLHFACKLESKIYFVN